MKKMNIDANPLFNLDDYLNELQAKLPNYDINVNNANDFSLMLEEKENCEKCLGLYMCRNMNQGLCSKYEDNSFKYEECRFKKELNEQNRNNSLIKTLYISKAILNAKLEDFEINCESRKKIYAQIVDFINNFTFEERKKGLYLYGSFSIGKTFTLGCIANELAKNNIKSLLIYFPDLVSDIKMAIGTDRLAELINMLKSIDVLMLDDLGSENLTPWVRDEILGPVINYRVNENKPVFVSSNISPKDMITHLAIDKSPAGELKAERIISRLQGLVVPVNMDDSNKYKR